MPFCKVKYIARSIYGRIILDKFRRVYRVPGQIIIA